MNQFDLNIDNYTIQDLEEFYKFPTKNYNKEDIKKNVELMKQNLFNSKEIDEKLKIKINEFLNKSSIVLVSNIRMNDTNHTFNPIKKTDIYSSRPYKYPNGLVNPVDVQTQTKTVCINSLFRNNFFNTSSSSFDYIFPTTIENVIKMRVSFAEIPIFWYDISSKKQNNTFTIKCFNMKYKGVSVADTTNTIVIEDGNYTNSALISYLNNYFYYTKNGLNFLIFSISEINAKVTFRAKTNSDNDSKSVYPFDSSNDYYSPDFKYTIIFSNTPFFETADTGTLEHLPNPYSNYLKSFASILGFRFNEYTLSSSNTFYDYSTATTYFCYLESEYSFGRYINQYLFLEINDYNNNFTTDSVISIVGNNNYVGNNIISVIPVTNNANTIMFNNTSDGIVKRRDYFGPVRLKKLTIRILNQYGDVLDLNGYDYFIILELQQLYTNYKTSI